MAAERILIDLETRVKGNRNIEKTNTSLGKTVVSAKGAASALKGLSSLKLGVIGAGSLAALGIALNRANNRVAQLRDNAAALNFPVGDLAAFQGVGEEVGVTAEQTSNFLGRLGRETESLTRGTGNLQRIFAAAGGTFRQEFLASEGTERLQVLGRALASVEDEQTRSSLAATVFTGQQRKLIGTITATDDGLTKQVNTYKNLTRVTEEQSMIYGQFDASSNRLRQAFAGLSTEGLQPFASIMTPINNLLTNAIVNTDGWVASTIAGSVALGGAAFSALSFAGGIGESLRGINQLRETLPGIIKSMKSFNLVQKIGTAITAAYNAVLALNPITLIIIAVVALIAGLVALIVYWDDVTAAIGRFFAAIKESATVQAIIGLFTSDPDAQTTTATPVEARQEGGPIQSGRPFLVGEAGPEIIIPDRSGNVISNKDSSALAGGRTYNISFGNINAPAGVTQELENTIIDTLNKIAPAVEATA